MQRILKALRLKILATSELHSCNQTCYISSEAQKKKKGHPTTEVQPFQCVLCEKSLIKSESLQPHLVYFLDLLFTTEEKYALVEIIRLGKKKD